MEAIKSLQPTDPLAQEAIVSLLGATLSELKKLDSAVVDGSSRLHAVPKVDVNKILTPHRTAVPTQPVYNINLPGSVPPPVQNNIQPHQFIQPPGGIIPPAPQQEIVEDPNQLVFDFNKPITPETINNKLDAIISKLDRLLDKSS